MSTFRRRFVPKHSAQPAADQRRFSTTFHLRRLFSTQHHHRSLPTQHHSKDEIESFRSICQSLHSVKSPFPAKNRPGFWSYSLMYHVPGYRGSWYHTMQINLEVLAVAQSKIIVCQLYLNVIHFVQNMVMLCGPENQLSDLFNLVAFKTYTQFV